MLLFATNAAIIRIGTGLLDRTLPKPEWTHAAHFAAAVWMIADRPDLLAARDLPPAIRAYNEATGVANTDTGGYHETITQASIRAAHHIVHMHSGKSLMDITNALLASPLGDKDWLLAYWSRPALFSMNARRKWLEPDLMPLPY